MRRTSQNQHEAQASDTISPKSFSKQDEKYMHRALTLALRGQGRVEPNPMVGCVIVRGKKIVGEGYHRRFGGPHAEIEALRAAGTVARGATAYVTLEPCCHYGKTPPCTKALIFAGVKRVIAAMRDPFPKVCGQGVRELKRAGIDVRIGLSEADAKQLNAPYIKRQQTGRPWVILKWAQSLDGKIATRTGDSKWISSETSRRWAHWLRSRVDAIIVGVSTVVTDDPELTCRFERPRRVASRIILDPQLRTPLAARVVTSASKIPTLIVTTPQSMNTKRVRAYAGKGVQLLTVRSSRIGLNLGDLLDQLGKREMTNVMIEGGGETLGSFYDAGLADEAVVFVSPRLIGGKDAVPALAGEGVARVQDAQPIATHLGHADIDDVYHFFWTK